MIVTNVRKDPETLTLTVTTEFDAPAERVWQMWEDPRQLEQWWGPPTYPATFVDHALAPGATSAYFMTGPEGDRHHGWWRIVAVDPPRRLAFEEGFADESGTPSADMPVTDMNVDVREESGAATRMTLTTTYASLEAMERLIAMGMEEGLVAAIGQIDSLLRSETATR
jgi:uncharacterized protein YndB with AHSA1/START domain